MKRSMLAAAAALLLATAAGAQAPEDEAVVLEDLIVPAHGGPPWWIVSDKDTKIYVMAVPFALPGGVTFNTALLEKRITGANEVILPATNDNDVPLLSRSALTKLFNDLNDNTRTTLEPSLPPAARARFVKLREAIGQPETRYGALPTGLAGMALAGDYRRRWFEEHPELNKVTAPATVAADIARKKRVKAAPAKVYRHIASLVSEARKPGLSCLEASLDQIERSRANPVDLPGLRADGIAWAGGDIRPILKRVRNQPARPGIQVFWNLGDKPFNLYTEAPACLNAMPTFAKSAREGLNDLINPIVKALKKKGHAVALVQAGPLLRRDGVLDQLRRKGFAVEASDGRLDGML